MRYRLTWFEDQALWTVDVEAPTESAARQAWVDGALPRPEALVQGVDLIDRMDCGKVTAPDTDTEVGRLVEDHDAWVLVMNSTGECHDLARRIIAEQSPVEFSRMLNYTKGWDL